MLGVVLAHTGHSGHVQQWEFALSNFQVDRLFMVGGNPPGSAVLAGATPIESSLDLPSVPLVLLAPSNGENIRGDQSLADFEHPADAVYWFGSDSQHIDEEVFYGRAPDHCVFIPTDTIDQMYSHAAWLVVAWDRRCKGV